MFDYGNALGCALILFMRDSLAQVTSDIDWMIEKLDYKHAEDL